MGAHQISCFSFTLIYKHPRWHHQQDEIRACLTGWEHLWTSGSIQCEQRCRLSHNFKQSILNLKDVWKPLWTLCANFYDFWHASAIKEYHDSLFDNGRWQLENLAWKVLWRQWFPEKRFQRSSSISNSTRAIRTSLTTTKIIQINC